MAAFTEVSLKKCFVLVLLLILLGMCFKTVINYVKGGTIREITVKVADRLPGPSITICAALQHGISEEDLLSWDRYPEDIMGDDRIMITDRYKYST